MKISKIPDSMFIIMKNLILNNHVFILSFIFLYIFIVIGDALAQNSMMDSTRLGIEMGNQMQRNRIEQENLDMQKLYLIMELQKHKLEMDRKRLELEIRKQELESLKGSNKVPINEDSQITRWHGVILANTEAIRLNPNDINAYINRGIAYGSLGNHQKALADFSTAIHLDQKNANAYTGRSYAYLNIGNYNQAIADSNRAIELDPNNSMHYNVRGYAYFRLEIYQQAIVDYNKVIELDPQNAMVYASRGDTYNKLGNIEEAIQDYKIGASLGHEGCQRVLRSNGITW